ncbi:MAG: pseudouridine synthase [Spirochaetia bacterium]|nr:pseudouridine synthase [Spirochaetia bacterium]
MFTVVYEDNDLLVVDKPAGLRTVPLKHDGSQADTLLGHVSRRYPEVCSFSGYNAWENGVLHRLDTDTSGLVVIARNKECFDKLAYAQKAGLFWKEYVAICSTEEKKPVPEGFPSYDLEDPKESGGVEVIVGSMFRPYGKGRQRVAPVTSGCSRIIGRKASGRWYETRIVYLGNNRYSCRLNNGYRHQIRAHLAWSGHPLDGDLLYGGKPGTQLGLRATEVKFRHPISEELVDICVG